MKTILFLAAILFLLPSPWSMFQRKRVEFRAAPSYYVQQNQRTHRNA